MTTKTIATTKYGKGYTIEFITGFNKPFKGIDFPSVPDNDIQILIKRADGTVITSAISKFGSYGAEEGLWEVMLKYPPKSWGDEVKGHLSFAEVMLHITEDCMKDMGEQV